MSEFHSYKSKFILAGHGYVSHPWKGLVSTFLNNLQVANLQYPTVYVTVDLMNALLFF